MSTANAYLTVSGIDIDIVYKDIKNLHIGVYPPFGRVRVAAPKKLSDDNIRLAIIQRLQWIKKSRSQLLATTRQSEREMINGESHYFMGVRYRLKVVERPGRAHIEIDGDRIVLYVTAGTSAEMRRRILADWYRKQLHNIIPAIISSWELRLKTTVPRYSVRRMKTKWGSCNRESRHIWLNTELAKKRFECLEYIIVHEMIHYQERNHNNNFVKLMNKVMPDWQSRRNLLNDEPLANEYWTTQA